MVFTLVSRPHEETGVQHVAERYYGWFDSTHETLLETDNHPIAWVIHFSDENAKTRRSEEHEGREKRISSKSFASFAPSRLRVLNHRGTEQR
jgi:hypothetical protein